MRNKSNVSDPSNDGRAQQEPLAIVGMACLFPKSDDVGAYWSNLKNGVDTISDIPSTHWNVEDFFDDDPKAPDRTYARRGGFLSPVDFDPLAFGIAPNDIEATDTTQLLGLMVAQQALEDAGYGEKGSFDRDRASVILGVTGTLELVIPLGARLGHPLWRRALKESGIDDDLTDTVVQKISDNYVEWQESSFPGLLGNVVAGRIANRLDLGGTNCVVDAACASSLGALHLAGLELASGRSDMVLAGGMDTFNDIFMYMCFSKTPALSPTGDCRPFDASADGTILGEGLGVLVLKRLADARRDKDAVHAVIRSVSASSDGKGTAVYAPVAKGQAKALRSAYAGAGISARSIELVEAHATGTKVGDATEVQSLSSVFREHDVDGKWCALGSVKSQLGHTKAAAGIAGVMKAALALKHKVLPPTLKVTEPLEVLKNGDSPFYVNTTKRPWAGSAEHPRRAAVSAFGFGGSNFHCVLEEAEASKSAPDFDGETVLLAFSAHTREELSSAVQAFPAERKGSDLRALAARSRSAFRHDGAHRLVLATEPAQLEKGLEGGVKLLKSQSDKTSWSTPDGAFYGSGAPEGSLAFLFPGQGSQYVGMLRDLSCQFPELVESLTRAGKPLNDMIYPHPAFDDETKASQEWALRATDVAQPAIGAVSLGALGVLRRFGLEPDAVAGHSYGELVALQAAEVFDADTLRVLSTLRGQLMAEGSSDRGAMLAVESDEETIESIITENALELVVANKNAPAQLVVSGATGAIEKAVTVFERRGLRCKRLAVSAAFHSALVADASEPLAKKLGELDLFTPKRKVYANATGETYPDDAAGIAELLASQLVRPVEFVNEIRNLYRDGTRLFLEVGPGSRLTGLVRSILDDDDVVAHALDASSGKRPGAVDLARALARVAAYGFSVALNQWDPEASSFSIEEERSKPALTVSLSGANYVKPKKRQEAPAPGRTRMSNQPPKPVKAPQLPDRDQAAAAPSQAPVVGAAGQSLINDALRMSQANMAALQKMQEQTAALHQQFLQGQESAHQTLQSLLDQQQRLVEQKLGLAPSPVRRAEPASVPVVPTPIPLAPLAAVAPPVQPIQPTQIVPPIAAPAPAPVAVPVPAPTEPPQAESAEVATQSTPVGGVDAANVEAVLLEVVAEKTGYPADILNLDMEMDSDLGIDSIKRVEILSSLQQRIPEAPPVGPEHLGNLRTLAQVVTFLTEDDSASSSPAPADAGAAPPTSAKPATETEPAEAEVVARTSSSGIDLKVGSSVLAAVSAKTGFPVDSLHMNMDLKSDLGIDHVKRAEIFSFLRDKTPTMPEIANGVVNSWRTLRNVVETLSDNMKTYSQPLANPTDAPVPTVDVDELTRRANSFRAKGPERSVLAVKVLDKAAERKKFSLAADGVVWISRDDSGLAAEVAKLIEALGHEPRLVALEDAVSLAPPSELAGLVLVGPANPDSERFLSQSLTLLRRAAPALRRSGRSTGSVFVTVSRLDGVFGVRAGSKGGSKGMGPATWPLSGGLAGLTKTASHEWPEVHCKAMDVTSGAHDAASLAVDIVDEIFFDGPLEVGLTTTGPVTLELSPRAIVPGDSSCELGKDDVIVISGGARGVTAAAARELARAFGSKLVLLGRTPPPSDEPAWLQGLTSEADIKKEIASRAGAGASPRHVGDEYRRLMASREIRQTLDDLADSADHVEYRAVDVRDGVAVRHILADVSAKLGPITALVHGAGVLADQLIEDKTEEQFSRVFGTKVGGMTALLDAVEIESLKVVVLFSSSTARFGRKGQVDYAVANEVLNKAAWQLAARVPSARVVSVGWGPWDGGMVTPALAKVFQDEGVGLIGLREGSRALVDEIRHGSRDVVEVVMLAPPETDASLSVSFEREIGVKQIPILKDHVLNGRAVVPLALIVEWMAHGAVHKNPGLRFHGFDDLRVLKGIILDAKETRVTRVFTGKAIKKNGPGHLSIPVEVRSTGADGKQHHHARATIHLASKLPAASGARLNTHTSPYHRPSDEIYRDLLFHGPALQGIQEVEGLSDDAITARTVPMSPPSRWLEEPLRNSWLADPLALDVAFQLMIVWSQETHQAASLPTYAGRYRQFRESFPAEGVSVVVKITGSGDSWARADMEFLDSDGGLVARLENYDCVVDTSLSEAFTRNRLSV